MPGPAQLNVEFSEPLMADRLASASSGAGDHSIDALQSRSYPRHSDGDRRRRLPPDTPASLSSPLSRNSALCGAVEQRALR